jgi:hypothetical protein
MIVSIVLSLVVLVVIITMCAYFVFLLVVDAKDWACSIHTMNRRYFFKQFTKLIGRV